MTRSQSLASATAAPAPTPLVVTEIEAAQMLRVSPRTLQRLRLEGGGPAFVQLTGTGSRIGYPVAALHAWLAARTVTSTSDATVNAGTANAGAK